VFILIIFYIPKQSTDLDYILCEALYQKLGNFIFAQS